MTDRTPVTTLADVVIASEGLAPPGTTHLQPEGQGVVRRINLRDLGFVGHVSDAARAEIKANERRSARVIQTAHLYWFGAPR